MPEIDFRPPGLLANRHLQSVLASMPPRRNWVRRAAGDFLRRSEAKIIDCGHGVRLLSYLTRPAAQSNGRLIVLIHGWEGSADSCYMLALGPALLDAGYTVVRLNLRDHGDSHHLNEDLFHSCRLAEVVGAVARIQEEYAPLRLSLAGYSLGGNFSLRVGAEAGRAGLELDRIVAICPVLDPAQTMAALDSGWAGYRQYFLQKWRSSLLKKCAAFPHLYSFGNLGRFDTLTGMTDFFVSGYTDYADLQSYLRGYAITGSRLSTLEANASMLLAEDDPVIPVTGLEDMQVPAALTVLRTRRGGHCGYLDWSGNWLSRFVLERLATD